MAVTTAVSDLFKSIYELFASVLGTIYAVIHGAFSFVWNFVTGILGLVQRVFTEAVHLTGGVGKFVASKYSYSRGGGLC
jgi:phage-related protein